MYPAGYPLASPMSPLSPAKADPYGMGAYPYAAQPTPGYGSAYPTSPNGYGAPPPPPPRVNSGLARLPQEGGHAPLPPSRMPKPASYHSLRGIGGSAASLAGLERAASQGRLAGIGGSSASLNAMGLDVPTMRTLGKSGGKGESPSASSLLKKIKIRNLI